MNPSPEVRRPLTSRQVILLKAPDKELLFVVRALMDLMHYARAEATQKMWEAYRTIATDSVLGNRTYTRIVERLTKTHGFMFTADE